MRGNRHRLVGWFGILILAAAALSASGEGAGPPVRLLVIDETKTFASTMRVAGVVGALKAAGRLAIDIRFADVASSYDDPLAGEAPPASGDRYDVILVFPRGLDDRSVRQIWIVSDGLDRIPPEMRAVVDLVSRIVDGAFAELARAVDVSEDLYPGCLWALYARRGWIR